MRNTFRKSCLSMILIFVIVMSNVLSVMAEGAEDLQGQPERMEEQVSGLEEENIPKADETESIDDNQSEA